MNMATAEIRARLVEKYRRSKYSKRAKTRIQELSPTVCYVTLFSFQVACLIIIKCENVTYMLQEELEIETKTNSQASWFKQLTTLTRRSLVNMSRDVGYYWARIAIYLVVSICVGTIFFDVGNSYTAILARVSCGAFITGFMTFMSIGGFPSFIEEIKVTKTPLLQPHAPKIMMIINCFMFCNRFSTKKG